MNGQKKILLLAAAVLAIALGGCSDSTEKEAQSTPLTKEEVKEAVRDGVLDASQGRSQFASEDLEPGEEYTGQNKIRARYRDYLLEEERKEKEAQKEWEDLQKEKEHKKAEKASEGNR